MASRVREITKRPADKENLKDGISKAAVKPPVVVTRRPAFKEVGNNENKKAVDKNVKKASFKDVNVGKPVILKPKALECPTEQIEEVIVDIDTSSDPLLVSEYAQDIYKYLLELEGKYTINEGFLTSHSLTPKMRSILIDWMVQVHSHFKLLLETLHLTVAIIDRYLQENKKVGKNNFQLVGVTSMLIACKYEEIYVPAISDFMYICDGTYTKKQMLTMEGDILKELNFNLGRPLSLHFLRRYSKTAKASSEHHTLAKYLLELALIELDMSHIRPSVQAAAAICLSVSVINELVDPAQAWTKTLEYYSGYKYVDIKSTLVKLACAIGRTETTKYQSISTKYSASCYNKISQNKKLKCNLVRKLIAKSPLINKK